jgi:hypothetical protein
VRQRTDSLDERAAERGIHGELSARLGFGNHRFLFTALGRRPVDNRAPVQRLFDAITVGDLDVIDTLVSPDFVDMARLLGRSRPDRRATR